MNSETFNKNILLETFGDHKHSRGNNSYNSTHFKRHTENNNGIEKSRYSIGHNSGHSYIAHKDSQKNRSADSSRYYDYYPYYTDYYGPNYPYYIDHYGSDYPYYPYYQYPYYPYNIELKEPKYMPNTPLIHRTEFPLSSATVNSETKLNEKQYFTNLTNANSNPNYYCMILVSLMVITIIILFIVYSYYY